MNLAVDLSKLTKKQLKIRADILKKSILQTEDRVAYFQSYLQNAKEQLTKVKDRLKELEGEKE